MTDNDQERKDQFGEYVKALRHEKGWTQADLAEIINLGNSTISRLENGNVADLLPHLEPLANAFELTELQKKELYAIAGYVYRIPPINIKFGDVRFEQMKQLLAEIEYPASIRTHLWDFLAFNEYHKVLWNYSDKRVQMLDDDSILGANLLRVLFGDKFQINNDELTFEQDSWQRNALMQFRRLSFPYITTKRYAEILGEMKENDNFKISWYATNITSRNAPPSIIKIAQATEIEHKVFGKLSFRSLRIPQRDLGEGIKISIYVPSPRRQENFEKMMESVIENKVYTFRPRPIE